MLVIGAAGQLGERMATIAAGSMEVVAWTRADIDITSVAVGDAVRSLRPDLVVNCAAYNNVEGAEAEPVEALEANAWAVRTLARAANDIDAIFVHFGTDFVFSGETDRPYTEEDTPEPGSNYASAKLLGDWFAAEAPRHYVLRVEILFGGPRRRSSVDLMLASIREGRPVRAFADRVVSPSFVNDVVSATLHLVHARSPYGLYHCVNSGFATWFDVAQELARLAGKPDAIIHAASMADVTLKARRPRFAALSNAKLAATGFTMPSWEDALKRYVLGAEC
jgi:dTDP-4-dehydrorhamnose reductase